MEPTATASEVAARTTATVLPIAVGVAAVGGCAIGVFVGLAASRDRKRDRRAFLKKLALDERITPAELVHYQQASDPIAEALATLAAPETEEPKLLAYRKAIACVL